VSSLAVDRVTMSFGEVQVLHGVDLLVASNEVCALLGPSGCGKTTLLRIVAGFEAPTSGVVSLAGKPVVQPGVWIPPEKRGITVVPQEGALFPHLSVGANVAFGLTGPKQERAGRVRELLDLVGLPGLARRRPFQLSGGQQQRVALARALAPNPKLILMDEPFSGLDAGLRAQVRGEVRDVLRFSGATAVLVTHDQTEALSMGDTVAVMADGQILMQGSPTAVYQSPNSLEVARFVGELVEVAGEAGSGRAQTIFGRHDLQQPLARPASSRGIVCFRPEQFVVGPQGTEAKIIRREYFGARARILAEISTVDGPLVVPVTTSGDAADLDLVCLEVRGAVSFFFPPSGDRPAG
jgi:iron(III) transport system ATP-binding protein